MFLNSPLAMLRRTFIALGAVACVCSFASPASAGPLCVGGETPFATDTGTGVCRNFTPGDNAKFFLFDAGTPFEHVLRITVDEVLEGPEPGESGFGLRFVRNLLPAGSSFPGFPSWTCVPYGPGGMCVEYKTAPPNEHAVENVDYTGDITWLVAWAQPIGTDPVPEIVHEDGDDADQIYDEILPGIFFSAELGPGDFSCDLPDFDTCGRFSDGELSKVYGDPVRVSTSDSFSSAAVVQQLPEPGALALLALGLGASVMKARRRR